jgi:hypothetical protein
MAAAVFGAIGHYLSYGPKKPKEDETGPSAL